MESDLKDNTMRLKGSTELDPSFITLNDGKNRDGSELLEGLRGIAQRYKYYENEYHRMILDNDPWKPATEIPDGEYSSIRNRLVQVDSGALRYLGSFHYGYHNIEKRAWFVIIGKGTQVEHEISQWRKLPRPPNITDKYEEVKKEVERLRSFL